MTHTIWRIGRVIVAGVAAGLGALGCGSDETASPRARLDLEHGYWQLAVNHDAVLLSTAAPYDTIRLVATPLNAAGAPLTGPVLDSVVATYVVTDPTDKNVTVSAAGLVRALRPDSTTIAVRLTVQGITRVHTIPLVVTSVPPSVPPYRLAIRVSPNDRPSISEIGDPYGGNRRFIDAQVTDANGLVVSSVPLALRSSDTLIARIAYDGIYNRMGLSIGRPGRAMVYASTTVFGTRIMDSAAVVVQAPSLADIFPRFLTPRASKSAIGYFPTADTILAGGRVRWWNDAPDHPLDVVFDDSLKVHALPEDDPDFRVRLCGSGSGGNIEVFARLPFPLDGAPRETIIAWMCSQFRGRSFPQPGIYHYHSELYKTSGVIVVVPRL